MLIKDKAGNIIFLEGSQSEETCRPIFLIPGKEKGQLIRTIVEQLDYEVEALQVITINIGGLDVKINLQYHPGGDGKAAKTATGLGGAICTMCIVLCILFAQFISEHTGAVQNGRCSLNS